MPGLSSPYRATHVGESTSDFWPFSRQGPQAARHPDRTVTARATLAREREDVGDEHFGDGLLIAAMDVRRAPSTHVTAGRTGVLTSR